MNDTNKLLDYEGSICSKLKEMMKIAKEINIQSKNYSKCMTESNIHSDLILFYETSDEMIILKKLMKKYNVNY